MKARFQILEFPTCLYQNKELQRETKPSKFSNTGKVLDTKTTFLFNGWEVMSIEGRGIPDARVAYLYLTYKQAQVLEQIGIKLKMVPERNLIAMSQDEKDAFYNRDMEYWKFKKKIHVLYTTEALGNSKVKTAHFSDGTTGEWWVKDGYCKFGWPDPSSKKNNEYRHLDPLSCEYKVQ